MTTPARDNFNRAASRALECFDAGHTQHVVEDFLDRVGADPATRHIQRNPKNAHRLGEQLERGRDEFVSALAELAP